MCTTFWKQSRPQMIGRPGENKIAKGAQGPLTLFKSLNVSLDHNQTKITKMIPEIENERYSDGDLEIDLFPTQDDSWMGDLSLSSPKTPEDTQTGSQSEKSNNETQRKNQKRNRKKRSPASKEKRKQQKREYQRRKKESAHNFAKDCPSLM